MLTKGWENGWAAQLAGPPNEIKNKRETMGNYCKKIFSPWRKGVGEEEK